MTQTDSSSSSPSSSAPWLGPSVKDMLASHTLAANIVARHVDPCPVLDGSELVLLRRFVTAPETYQEILEDCDMVPNDKDGSGPRHGSLVGWVIHLHAEAQRGNNGKEPPLDDEEIALLEKWFGRGQADSKMAGCVETGKRQPAEQKVEE